MGATAAYWVPALIGAGTAAYTSDQSRKTSNRAADRNREQAKTATEQQQRDVNAANARAPDVNALLAAQTAAAKGGPGSTMLTGPQGIDPSLLTLGRTTLLGGG